MSKFEVWHKGEWVKPTRITAKSSRMTDSWTYVVRIGRTVAFIPAEVSHRIMRDAQLEDVRS